MQGAGFEARPRKTQSTESQQGPHHTSVQKQTGLAILMENIKQEIVQ